VVFCKTFMWASRITVIINSCIIATIGTGLASFYIHGVWANVDLNQPTPTPICKHLTITLFGGSCTPSTPVNFTCLAAVDSNTYILNANNMDSWKFEGVMFGLLSILIAFNILLHDLYVLQDGGQEMYIFASPQFALRIPPSLQAFASWTWNSKYFVVKVFVALLWIVLFIPTVFILALVGVVWHAILSALHPLRYSYINIIVSHFFLLVNSFIILVSCAMIYANGVALYLENYGGVCTCTCLYPHTTPHTTHHTPPTHHTPHTTHHTHTPHHPTPTTTPPPHPQLDSK
jgi:hypothetical protein